MADPNEEIRSTSFLISSVKFKILCVDFQKKLILQGKKKIGEENSGKWRTVFYFTFLVFFPEPSKGRGQTRYNTIK